VSWDQLRSSYDLVAGKYLTQFLDELDGKPYDRALLQAYADSVDDPVADIGCGPGQVGSFVRQRGRTVMGVDLSMAMATLARHRLDAGVVGDLRRLPFRSGQLGGLVAFYSLIHVRRTELGAALAEFCRVLRPGGRVLLSAHEGRGQIEADEFLGQPAPFVASLFGLEELIAATERAGLHVMTTHRRPPYPFEHQTVRLYVEAERRFPG